MTDNSLDHKISINKFTKCQVIQGMLLEFDL